MKVTIPDSSQDISSQNKTTTSWFTYFQDVWKAIRGGTGISIGGTLSINTTSVANSGSGETDLMTYTTAADLLVNDGDELCFKTWGIYAANGNNKTVKVKFGSQTILTTGAIAANDGSWSIEGSILRKTATTQEIIVNIISSNSSISDSCTRTAGTQDLSASNILKLTGQGSSSDDVTEYALIIKLTPNS